MIQFSPDPRGREALEVFLRRLLAADWDSTTGPMSFNATLSLQDLAEVVFLQNIRLFLTAVDEAGGAPTTATGNLNRVLVRQMFDRLVLQKRFRETTLQVCKVLNEQDVWPLHIVRIVTECAGLVARRKQRFHLTRTGRQMLPDSAAGQLFRTVFLAYFRKFDLHYDFPHREVPGIQQTMAAILWRLDNVARDWVPVKGLAEQILLPGVLDQLRAAMVSPYDKEEWILRGYVLDPLVGLGLIERKSRDDWPFDEKDHVRVTPLWCKFIHFEHWADSLIEH